MSGKKRFAAAAIAVALAAGSLASTAPAVAQPGWAGKDQEKGKGKGKGKGNSDRDRETRRDDRDRGPRTEVRFESRDRDIVRVYYGEREKSGWCPPGLARKRNGCQPPGQAKKWAKGRPLPREVIYYDLEPQLVVRLGVPPSGHKYVRVAGDILLIAVGTALVVDAITDLGRI